MSLPNQVAAFTDCYDLYERALHDSLGARAKLPSYKDATLYQLRLHHARSLLRLESRRIYDSADIRYNKSEFDCLKATVRMDPSGAWWVYITRHGQEVETIESLSESGPEALETLRSIPPETLRITHQPIPITIDSPIKRRF